ncbi:UBX domain-containing protein 1 [Candida viswanathii]|uniref:UBX domain-containing protein 1 n=1 Tax=Candida viswanathii TaxID=5486 RepID=A0A367Y9Z7_9ASCO|nr:UBX domain-containing protein 1 [Candida viswanathii]
MQQPDDRPSARHNDEDELSGVKFSGKGFKLGDGNEPSQVIEDPNASLKKFRPSKVTREITFWKQGFTVGDGPLHRYDDPRNATVLQELNQGRVPMSILDVEFGQDVDVSVFKKTDEDWTPPKRKIGGYHGSGHRLGSPVPGEPIVKESTPSQPPVEITGSNKPKDDQGEGDSTVQIRFANGKRTSHKFNSTDSIVKVYDFVKNHENNSDPDREFTLSHAFPVKPIEESDDVTVADAN